MNTQTIRIRLIELDLKLKDLAGRSGIDYDRLQKILHGYRTARPEEIRAIADALGVPDFEVGEIRRPADSGTHDDSHGMAALGGLTKLTRK